jgi:hypothetical protein
MNRRGFVGMLAACAGLGRLLPAPKVQQLVFHKDAFAFAMAPLKPWSYDVLYGSGVVQPRLACRLTDWTEAPFSLTEDELYRIATARPDLAKRL